MSLADPEDSQPLFYDEPTPTPISFMPPSEIETLDPPYAEPDTEQPPPVTHQDIFSELQELRREVKKINEQLSLISRILVE